MFRGIIGLVEGAPDGEIHSTRGMTDVEAERIESFDDGQLVSGKAVGSVRRQRDVPEVGEEYITTEREEGGYEVYIEFLADLSTGWVTIDSSDGEFLWEHLEREHGVAIIRAQVDVDGFAAEIREWDDTTVWQSQAAWDDPDEEAGGITIAYHDDADWSKDRIGQFGFSTLWQGMLLRGIVTRSGYFSLFNRGEEVAAQFLNEVLLSYCSIPDEEQATLKVGGESE